MKKTIDGQIVEGTPAEIAEYEQIVAAQAVEVPDGRRPQLVKTSPDAWPARRVKPGVYRPIRLAIT